MSDVNPNNPDANNGQTSDGLLELGRKITGYALGAAAESIGTQKQTTLAASGADTVAAKTSAATDPKRILMIVGAVVIGALILVKLIKK